MTADAEPELVGSLLDSLGTRLENPVGPGELATDAVVILRVLRDDGRVVVRWAESDGIDLVTRAGLLAILGQHLEAEPCWAREA